MKNSDRDRFDGRLKTASEAKQIRLERFQAAADDPVKRANRAKRDAAAVARKSERQVKATKLLQEKEEQERLKAVAVKREETQAAVRKEALEAELAEAAEQVIANAATHEAERKAERDRRYAARKNRKR